MSVRAREGANQIPFLRTSNVLWDEIDLTSVDQMALSESELAEKTLLRGDLLVCEGGDIGRSAVWTGETSPMSFQNHLHRLRPLGDEVYPRFYVYFLQSAFTQLGLFEGAGNKTTIPNLSRNRLAGLEVPHPPRAEQAAISEVLAQVRRAIKVNQRLVATSELLKAAAMGQLFTCGLRGGAQKETPFGGAPSNWILEKIGDLATKIQYGLSLRGLPSGQYPILRMNCQEQGRVVFRNLQYVDLAQVAFESFRLAPGDILFNRTNSFELVGRSAIFEADMDTVFASYLVRLRMDPARVEPRFLNHFLNWDVTQSELKKLASRAVGQANISAGKLSQFLVPFPPLDEQHEIVRVLDAIEDKIEIHKKKHAVLTDLFKSLLHKLMTGELRVVDLDLAALPVRTDPNN